MTKFIKIFFLSILLYGFLFAQNDLLQSNLSIIEAQNKYSVENITVSNGLYNNYIFDVLQDHLGFLWLASDIGLQKYDGYTFTLYTSDSSDVSSQKALRLYEDKQGNLWAQMKEGLIRYSRELDKFIKYYFVNEKIDTISYQVTAMSEDSTGNLWVWVQNKGLYKVDVNNKTFVPHKKVNKWVSEIKKPVFLKKVNHKGFYEAIITFPKGYYGLKLEYKYLIKRNDGTREWELNAKQGSDYINREVILTGDTLNLPVVTFNSKRKTGQKNIKLINKTKAKSTVIKFNLNLDKYDYPISEGEVIQIRGNRLPLMWDENVVVKSMIFDLNNKLWIDMGSLGLYRFNLETDEDKEFISIPGISGNMDSGNINAVLCDQDGNLWLGTDRGLYRYSPDNKILKKYFIDPYKRSDVKNHIYRMTDDGHGNIWTISNDVKGIGCFNKIKKDFNHYSRGLNAWISSVTTDRSGIVWLGNWYQGIYKLDPLSSKFSTFSVKNNERDILEGKLILALYEDPAGEIWFGGDLDGLYRYNRKTGKISVYRIKGGNFDSSVENYILDIFKDSKGNFWIGTRGGLCHFNSETGNFKHILQPPTLYQGLGRMHRIHEDTNGILWMITANGFLVQFDPNTFTTEYYSLNGKNLSFREFVFDPRGFLWIGSALEEGEGGVLKFDLNQKTLSVVNQLQNYNINSLCIDDEILWCGTNESGLIRYDTKADTKTSIRLSDGLLSNSVLGLELDSSGDLWISSPRGLTKYNPQKSIFNNYFKEDGFFTNEFTYRAHYKAENGEMIFGTLHGIVTFHPESIKNSEFVPRIVLTDIKIHNESIGIGGNSPLKKHISVINKIELTHDQNDITITFASLDFHHPERIRYSFYLENFEKNWREPGLERSAYYTNLDPGVYVFKVKGTNSDGVWNNKGTSLKIVILPPWWETWWAYAIYVLALLGILYFIRRYELNRQNLKHSWELERMETEKYQEIDRMKSRFFANISHEFRTPLTLIKGPVQQMLSGDFKGNIKNQYRMILRNTNRLLQLINQLLDLSKLDSGQMVLRTSPVDIVPLVKGLTQSFESLAKQKMIDLRFQSYSDEAIVFIDGDKFEKIIINILINAFKFTPVGGFVSVKIDSTLNKVSDDVEYAEIAITNSGEGISPEHLDKIFDRFYQADDTSIRNYEGTGIGLALTKELVELHQGKISVESEPGTETTFKIYLPVGKDHLLPEEIIATTQEIPSDVEVDSELIGSSFLSVTKTGAASYKRGNDFYTLLIVDDNADMRNYMRETLRLNYKIIEAENGEEGIQKSLKHSPDMIISDVMMPVMDGFQFCSEIKKDERTSHIPVILLTARASGESKIEGLETGADEYLTKPFDNKELQVRIKNLIEQRKKLQEKFRKEITVSPHDITVTSIDEQLVKKAIDVIEKNIGDANFDTTMMAREVGISRMLLNTKLKALTGLPTGEFIRTIRLKRAAQLLQQGYGNVTDVAYEVGFQSLSYFAKAFRKQFGKPPSHYSSKDLDNPGR